MLNARNKVLCKPTKVRIVHCQIMAQEPKTIEISLMLCLTSENHLSKLAQNTLKKNYKVFSIEKYFYHLVSVMFSFINTCI